MTFAAALAWSALRAGLIALAAWPVCLALENQLREAGESRHRWRWLAVIGPFLFPELLVGYAYAPWVAGRPMPAEIACTLLMFPRIVPVGVIAWRLTPPSAITPSALHCQWLLIRTWSDRFAWLRLWFAGPVTSAIPMLSLMALVAFQQFELAALLRAVSWSDWLFVQQVGGLSLEASLQAAIGPAIGQLLLIALGLAVIARRSHDGPAVVVPARFVARDRGIAAAYLVVAWIVVIGWPTVSLLPGLPAGLRQLMTQPLRMRGLMRELFAGLAAAVLAAVIAWIIAVPAPSASEGRRNFSLPRLRSGLGRIILIVPGLFGSLLLGLALVAIFQSPPLRILYDTPLPWVIGLFFYLLPRALLLRSSLNDSNAGSAEFLAKRLESSPEAAQRAHGRRLLWRLVDEPRFFAVAMLTYWGYLDLTTAYLLSPTGLTSGVVRLYNFMHFGRTAALTAEAAVLLLGPFVIVASVWPLVRRVRT